MKTKISILLGVFAVMALSNTIVPVLPFFADESPAIQGAIFSAYFMGAFLTVLPAGIFSDRIGKIPLIRVGLVLTVISGIVMYIFPEVYLVVFSRLIEGIAAGLFVACAMSWVNEQADHRKLSGYFFACLNLGLVIGLVAAGLLSSPFGETSGILFFTLISAIPMLTSLVAYEKFEKSYRKADLKVVVLDYKWLYLSVIILVGATGVVTSLYPEFTDNSPLLLSIQLGTMNVATIFASLIAPRFEISPIPALKKSAIVMAFLVLLSYYIPEIHFMGVFLVFAMIGAIAGFIMISQMDYLAQTGYLQGTVMGVYSAAAYAGMTFLPLFAGIIAEESGYLPAFFVVAVLSFSVAFTITRCNICKLENA
ncbi:MFS transporter [Methanoplanus sp. FWC-SCC4]|uniref:MFS transporter n=1 Tax=Methanochimaera problematica TaxID=2609417 RepID=A0AA97FCF9_9EURY|nr:MFS transporter [Methanoplanus sp. FWC-SCC4]WOF15962.1 MFS transporter [Methanoplanus sp. FWC-SCC4]